MKENRVRFLCVVVGLSILIAAAASSDANRALAQQVPTPVPPPPLPTASPSPRQESPPPEERNDEGAAPTSEQQEAPASGSNAGPALSIPNILRSPSKTTARLVEILMPLAERGMPLDQALVASAAPFPVAGHAWFTHDWGFPRYTPYPHLHEGTDIFADFGTPVVASGPGVVAGFGNSTVGGLSVWISGDDAHGYFYTHLLGFPEGLHVGQRVDMGTVIGFVGNTGNAASTSPHVHFEIHAPVLDKKGRVLAGGAIPSANGLAYTPTPPVDPKPFLDAWLVQAEARAQQFVIEMVERYAVVARHVHISRRVDEMFPAEGAQRPGDLVWLSLMSPVAAELGIAKEATLLGVSASRTPEEAAAESVRLAVYARDLKLASFTGSRSPMFVLPAGS